MSTVFSQICILDAITLWPLC